MRLLEKEKRRIISVFTQNLKKIPFRLYVHGSRLNDEKHGGDIDLIAIYNSDIDLSESKVKIQIDLFRELQEQKIDLLFLSENETQNNAFYQSLKVKELIYNSLKPNA